VPLSTAAHAEASSAAHLRVHGRPRAEASEARRIDPRLVRAELARMRVQHRIILHARMHTQSREHR